MDPAAHRSSRRRTWSWLRRTWSWLRRMWEEHEEGVLYTIAVVVYIPAGVFLKTVVLNWIFGILFPLIVVYLIPTWIRRLRASEPSGRERGRRASGASS